MLIDDIRALKRSIPKDEQLAALAQARNDALEEAVRVVEEAFETTSGELGIISVNDSRHPVAERVAVYLGVSDD